MSAPAPSSLVRTHGVRLGLSVPGTVGPAGQSLEWTLARCLNLGVVVVDIAIDTLEMELGAPVPTVPIEPPPVDGLAFGLLELEEDVLRDSYELARQTFDAHIRTWRASAQLAPLDDLRRTWQTAGVSIDIVRIPDLVLWSDDEVDYACLVARAVGARTLTTRASLAGPRRLAALVGGHSLQLSFTNDHTTGAADLGRLLAHGDSITVGVDIDAWTAGGLGSPVAFLKEHAPRISHVRLRNVDTTLITEVLRLMRDNAWPFSAMLEVDATGDAWLAATRDMLDNYRAALG